jgi:hypothetical protein
MLDSTSTVNAIQTSGQIATAVTTIIGQQTIGNLISLIISAVVSVTAFIFGHRHGISVSNGTKPTA